MPTDTVTPLVAVTTVALATVFAAAGIAKLRDRTGSREAASAFGVPERVAPVLAIGLPVAELAITLLLLPTATRWWAAVGALALLLLFCAAIARAMARGEAPECHCFGQLHSTPAGWRTLTRNAVLAAAAVFVVIAGRDDAGQSVFAWTSRLDGVTWLVLSLGVALVATIAVGGYTVLHTLRSYGRVLLRLDAAEGRLHAAGLDPHATHDGPGLGLEPGTTAPDFQLPSVDGQRVGLADLAAAGNPVLLLFTSPTCGPCSVLMPTIAEWQREHHGELTVALVSGGDPGAIRAEAANHELVNVLLDEDLTTYEAYGANGTPSAVLVGEDGTVATWLAAGSDWIESVVEQALSGVGRLPGLPLGAELPALQAQTLDGEDISLADAVERDSLLLFWNPDCSFCRSLHEDLLAFEAAAPENAPALVVVSTGERAEVEQEGFTSTVLLDPDWTVSAALGATGTPMAVIVSAEKRIASRVVSGGESVLELLGAGELARAR